VGDRVGEGVGEGDGDGVDVGKGEGGTECVDVGVCCRRVAVGTKAVFVGVLEAECTGVGVARRPASRRPQERQQAPKTSSSKVNQTCLVIPFPQGNAMAIAPLTLFLFQNSQ